MENITIGRIVEFHINNCKGPQLNMKSGGKSAPAIVVNVCPDTDCCNLNVFTDDHLEPVKLAVNISHGMAYWDWLPRV
jgi:hypothetical protein